MIQNDKQNGIFWNKTKKKAVNESQESIKPLPKEQSQASRKWVQKNAYFTLKMAMHALSRFFKKLP